MTDNWNVDKIEDVKALDEFDGEQADQEVGDFVDSEADVHPEGIAARLEDFKFPEVEDD